MSDFTTWGEFKAEVEKAGVKDEDRIAWIDTGPYGPDNIDRDENDNVTIS